MMVTRKTNQIEFDDQLFEPLRGQSIPPPASHSIDSVGTRKSERVWAFSLTKIPAVQAAS